MDHIAEIFSSNLTHFFRISKLQKFFGVWKNKTNFGSTSFVAVWAKPKIKTKEGSTLFQTLMWAKPKIKEGSTSFVTVWAKPKTKRPKEVQLPLLQRGRSPIPKEVQLLLLQRGRSPKSKSRL